MDVMQAITDRRSIRKFRDEPVTDEALNTVLEAIRQAPSWSNTQCWRIIVVRDKETRAKLSDALIDLKMGAKNPATDAVKNAPVVIAACAERNRSGYYKGGDNQKVLAPDIGEWWFMFDMGVAMQNAALAAQALGLGTVHVGLLDAGKVASILNVPDNLIAVELMPVGWPDEQPSARPRKEKNEIIFMERYPDQD